MTTLDWVLLSFLGLFAISRAHKGLAYSLEEFVGLTATMSAAFIGYRAAGFAVLAFFDIRPGQAYLFGFAALVIIGQFLCRLLSVLARSRYGARRLEGEQRRYRGPQYYLHPNGVSGPLSTSTHKKPHHRVLAVLPAEATGVLALAIILSAVYVVPPAGKAATYIDESKLAGRLVAIARPLHGAVEEVFGTAYADVSAVSREHFGPAHRGPAVATPPALVDQGAEKEMLWLINRERTARGLDPVQSSKPLTEMARAHSRDMAVNEYFDHTSPRYGGFIERLSIFNVRYRVAGENLALAADARAAHRALMRSPHHRENILRPGFRKVGIGAIKDGSSGVMFTQEFSD